ncbi:hypothetical protein [Rhodohalobacter sp. 614A]|uniref:hypothetical protein n=1 Tax=Rhodohalobacter sp. 614A TaxID=2908649 RepID=UPI001F3D3F73|nr:hypothetical protein [Rhodohalobacter sp. 614A]
MGEDTYTFQDWLDGKLDGLDHWTTPATGQEPFVLNMEGQLPDEEYQKIVDAQYDILDKAIEVAVHGHIRFFFEKIGKVKEDKKNVFYQREFSDIQNRINEIDKVTKDRFDMEKMSVLGIDSKKYYKFQEYYQNYKKGGYTVINLTYYVYDKSKNKSKIQTNVDFTYRKLVGYLSELEKLKEEYAPAPDTEKRKPIYRELFYEKFWEYRNAGLGRPESYSKLRGWIKEMRYSVQEIIDKGVPINDEEKFYRNAYNNRPD